MTSEGYILTVDQGTTGTRASLVDHSGQILWTTYKEVPQIYPRPGWVEQDPLLITESVFQTIEDLLDDYEVSPNEIRGLGLTNQRETTSCEYIGNSAAAPWNTGPRNYNADYNAFLNPDKEQISKVDRMNQGYEPLFNGTQNVLPDSYFNTLNIGDLLNEDKYNPLLYHKDNIHLNK